ncbi:MAG: hypothetical protein ACRD3G_25230 [Vicinamibacterales bacterium]
MIGPPVRVAAALRHAAVPLAAYYAVTLALPLANGAASAGARFAVHAVMVLVVPPVAIVLGCGFYDFARACLRAAINKPARLRRQTGCAADSRSLRGS